MITVVRIIQIDELTILLRTEKNYDKNDCDKADEIHREANKYRIKTCFKGAPLPRL